MVGGDTKGGNREEETGEEETREEAQWVKFTSCLMVLVLRLRGGREK